MKVICHYPKKQKDMDKLQNLITKVHATAVVNYIDKLTCPTEQKLQIINEFISDEKIAGQL